MKLKANYLDRHFGMTYLQILSFGDTPAVYFVLKVTVLFLQIVAYKEVWLCSAQSLRNRQIYLKKGGSQSYEPGLKGRNIYYQNAQVVFVIIQTPG